MTVPATSLHGTRTFVLPVGNGKYLHQSNSPFVMAVVCTRMRCSSAAKSGVGVGWSVIMVTLLLILSGCKTALCVLGMAIVRDGGEMCLCEVNKFRLLVLTYNPMVVDVISGLLAIAGGDWLYEDDDC
jgi:hypothetical protein